MTAFSQKLPVWYQLAMMLRSDILNGAMRDGDQIEPEVDLAARHGISVMPVRQALRSLEAEGLIIRQRGRGTFVHLKPRVPVGHTSLESLYSKQFHEKPQILERGRVATPASFRSAFGDCQELCFIRRVAYRDKKAWSYGILYFLTMFEERMTTSLLQRFPVYRVMQDKCGIQLLRSDFVIKAAPATHAVAAYLGIDPFSPVLHHRAISYDETGLAVGAHEMDFVGESGSFSFAVLHGTGE